MVHLLQRSQQSMDLDISRFSGTSTSANRPLILAADDNEDNLLLLIHALELFGFANISTLQGQAVLNLAKSYRPDLILLDMVLSDANGIDIVEQLKKSPETASIPVVAVTALASTEDRERMIRIGCSDCLSKPYDLDELEIVLRSYLASNLPSAS